MITSEEEFDRLPQTVKMRQDLQDSERRIALREEYKKEDLPRFYPDIREDLQLTAEQEGRLFDLLADFQLQHLDLFYTKERESLAKHKRIQENEQRRDEALHSLLGTDTLQKYRRYQLDLWERQFVARLSRWLNPANALSPEQKSQLMTVLSSQREQAHRESEEERRERLQAVLRGNKSAASLLEANIRSNENHLKQMEAESRQLLQQAASFLSTGQLGTLTRMENLTLEARRRAVDSLRAQRASASSALQAPTSFAVNQAELLPDLLDNPEASSGAVNGKTTTPRPGGFTHRRLREFVDRYFASRTRPRRRCGVLQPQFERGRDREGVGNMKPIAETRGVTCRCGCLHRYLDLFRECGGR